MYYDDQVRIEGIAEPWPSPGIARKLHRKHSVTPEEVEEALFNGDQRLVRKGRDGTFEIYSRTDAGRHLLVIVAPRASRMVYVVTSRQMIDSERRLYEKGMSR
jgi:uncharacterized DUF497 family protein